MKENGIVRLIPGHPLYTIDTFGNIDRIYKSKSVRMKPAVKKGKYVIRLQGEEGRKDWGRI